MLRDQRSHVALRISRFISVSRSLEYTCTVGMKPPCNTSHLGSPVWEASCARVDRCEIVQYLTEYQSMRPH
jgi:hypothetical protein